ncbi:MAG: glucosamine-6-phosphate isomerase [Clostridia bacterium]|nr:glucosamine-6-phosphate isomerase [Clostridia bacterium]
MHDYYRIPAGELGKNAKIPLKCLGDSGEIFYEMALEMVETIQRNNAQGKRTVFIVPVGPVGQYPIFVRLVNEKRVSLKNCWFFNMDEYMLDEVTKVSPDDPLSFIGFMEKQVYGRIDPALILPPDQRIYPDPIHPERGDALLHDLGGAEICFGGIGINGHLAFNEPQASLTPEQFAALPTRVLSISRETRTANAIGDLGGAIEDMPPYCVSIGFHQIFTAQKVRLGVFRDWHRAVVRRAAYGEITAAFPATLLQNHPDALIYVNANAAKCPVER